MLPRAKKAQQNGHKCHPAIFSHAGKLYSAKRANLGVQIFGILVLIQIWAWGSLD